MDGNLVPPTATYCSLGGAVREDWGTRYAVIILTMNGSDIEK